MKTASAWIILTVIMFVWIGVTGKIQRLLFREYPQSNGDLVWGRWMRGGSPKARRYRIVLVCWALAWPIVFSVVSWALREAGWL